MARPRGGGNRAPDLHPPRSGDERHSEDRGAAFDFALRAFRAGDEFRIRAPIRISCASRRLSGWRTRRCRTASRPAFLRCSAPADLIYRYVLVSPDRTPQELKTIEDWVLERRYRAIPESPTIPGLGGTTMQYQVLLNPYRLFSYGVTVPQVFQQLSINNSNAGGGFYSQGGQFYYIRGLGLVKTTEDIGNVVVATNNGIPTYVKDVGKVEIGHAVRLGEFGYMKQDDAVEGVILMRVGEQAQVVLKRVENTDQGTERARAAAGRQDRSLLRPQRADRGNHANRGAEPDPRHAAGADRPRHVSVQRARGASSSPSPFRSR